MPPVCWLGLLVIVIGGLLWWALMADDGGPGRSPLDGEIRAAERRERHKQERRRP